MQCLGISVLGYLVGCINPAYIFSRIKGFDIRETGTNNAGATNVMFSMGFKWGVVVMLVDVLKAFIIVRIGLHMANIARLCSAIGGISCMIGHMFPFYMKGKGGKGVACMTGVILAETPILVIPIALILFLMGVVINRASILPSVVAFSYPFIFYGVTRDISASLIIALMFPLILFAHRENKQRYREGRESQFRKVIFGSLDDCIERCGMEEDIFSADDPNAETVD